MKKVRKALMVLGVLLMLLCAVFLDYVLPRHVVVHVSGNEVKRVDQQGHVVDASKAIGATRDVFFINASNPATGEVYVFRNEDTRFGFPFYLKFDSPEVLARAQMLMANPDQRALVTYYGWRIKMLDEFPNAVNIEKWDSPEPPFPVFNTVFFVLLTLLVLLVWWKVRKLKQAWQAKKEAS